NYTGLQNAWAGRPVEAAMRPDQPVTGRYQLLMGPWYHGNVGQGVNLTLLELQWFDTWLRGEPTGVDRTPTPLHIHEEGGDRAVDAGSWAAADGGLLLPHHPLTRPSESLLTPGQITRFDIEVYPVYALIRKGHTFRLTIATSDTPHLVPTPEQLAHLAGGVYQVVHGGSA